MTNNTVAKNSNRVKKVIIAMGSVQAKSVARAFTDFFNRYPDRADDYFVVCLDVDETAINDLKDGLPNSVARRFMFPKIGIDSKGWEYLVSDPIGRGGLP